MTTLKIKDWHEGERPRERLMMKGATALSDAELVAILLHSGTRNQTVIDLARNIMSLAHNNLTELGKLDLKQLRSIKGVGFAKGLTLLAALELGRRRGMSQPMERPVITKAADVQHIIGPLLSDLPYEEFWVLALNQAGRLIDKQKIGHGGLSATMADTRIVFKFALETSATRLLLVHNHPSGEKNPSKDDINLTLHLQNAGNILNINIVDHVIIAGNNYFSFKDEGLL
jgi:DNA repair protein RadC